PFRQVPFDLLAEQIRQPPRVFAKLLPPGVDLIEDALMMPRLLLRVRVKVQPARRVGRLHWRSLAELKAGSNSPLLDDGAHVGSFQHEAELLLGVEDVDQTAALVGSDGDNRANLAVQAVDFHDAAVLVGAEEDGALAA